MNQYRTVMAALLALVLFSGSAHAAESREPKASGTRPPALAPFAQDDPIPQVSLRPHKEQSTPRQAVETFLYHLSRGYDPSILSKAGGTVGDPRSYEKAWSLLVPERESLSDSAGPWRGAARMKVLQVETMQRPDRFFVEIQSVAWCDDHWATAFWWGTLETVKTTDGWRISGSAFRPEHLVFSNIGGHQGWQHSDRIMALWYAALAAGGPREPGRDNWVLNRLVYERRTVTATLRHRETGAEQTLRMARMMEGSWWLLSMAPEPAAPPPRPIP